jgi:hypothetical protein
MQGRIGGFTGVPDRSLTVAALIDDSRLEDREMSKIKEPAESRLQVGLPAPQDNTGKLRRR